MSDTPIRAEVSGMYQWPTWWGTVARGDAPPQIHAKLREIRRMTGGLVAKKVVGGAPHPVRSAKDLVIKLRAAIDEHDCHVMVVAQKVTPIDVDRGTACLVESRVRICAPDGSYVDFLGVGHGTDSGDKGAGKGSTYAYKDALTKGLTIPDKEMVDTDDEQNVPVKRAPGAKTATAATPTAGLTEEAGRAAIAACKTPEELRALVASWRQPGAINPEVGVKLGPVAAARMGELQGAG